MPHHRLDPVRLPPRPRSLFRYAAVAALLALAAGVLLVDPAVPGVTSAACRATSRPSPDLATSTGTRRHRAALPVPAGMVGVPVQLAEPGTAAVLRPGDRVDVIARTGRPAAPSGGPDDTGHTVLARDVLVLATGAGHAESPDEGIVYLGMPAEQARRVARTAPDVAIGVTVRPH